MARSAVVLDPHEYARLREELNAKLIALTVKERGDALERFRNSEGSHALTLLVRVGFGMPLDAIANDLNIDAAHIWDAAINVIEIFKREYVR